MYLPNEQIKELITAVSSTRKNDLPEQRQDGQYMGAWHELDRQARETAQIANSHKWPVEKPTDFTFSVLLAIVVLAGLLSLRECLKGIIK